MLKALNEAKLNLQVSLDHQVTMNNIGLHRETVGLIHQLQALLIDPTYPCGKENHSLVFRQIWSIGFWLSISRMFTWVPMSLGLFNYYLTRIRTSGH